MRMRKETLLILRLSRTTSLCVHFELYCFTCTGAPFDVHQYARYNLLKRRTVERVATILVKVTHNALPAKHQQEKKESRNRQNY